MRKHVPVLVFIFAMAASAGGLFVTFGLVIPPGAITSPVLGIFNGALILCLSVLAAMVIDRAWGVVRRLRRIR